MNLNRFAELAAVRSYVNDVGAMPSYDTVSQDLQNLLGINESTTSVVQSQLTRVQEIINLQQCIQQDLASIKAQADVEYVEMLTHMSTREWFDNHLLIGPGHRDQWRLEDAEYHEILLIISSIQDIWKYPVACINAQHTHLVTAMLSAEMLYCVDTNRSTVEQFYNSLDDSLKTKCKTHVVEEFHRIGYDNIPAGFKSRPSFGVPKGQMALVVCLNIFQRLTAEYIRDFLTQTKTIMRPGGLFVCNVYDAERDNVAQLMADGMVSGITRSQLSQIAEELGMTLVRWQSTLGHDLRIAVLKMPGELYSPKKDISRAFRKKS